MKFLDPNPEPLQNNQTTLKYSTLNNQSTLNSQSTLDSQSTLNH